MDARGWARGRLELEGVAFGAEITLFVIEARVPVAGGEIAEDDAEEKKENRAERVNQFPGLPGEPEAVGAVIGKKPINIEHLNPRMHQKLKQNPHPHKRQKIKHFFHLNCCLFNFFNRLIKPNHY